jgi:hypothetical protein
MHEELLNTPDLMPHARRIAGMGEIIGRTCRRKKRSDPGNEHQDGVDEDAECE